MTRQTRVATNMCAVQTQAQAYEERERERHVLDGLSVFSFVRAANAASEEAAK